jgi:plasmid maintenance system antidote protein VapI
MHEKVAETIRIYDIPRSTVAKLSGLWLTDLSAWLNGRQSLNAERVARIAQTVDNIVNVIRTLPMKVDLRDAENVRRLIMAVNDAALQMNLLDALLETPAAVSASRG